MDERGNAIPYSRVIFNLVVGLVKHPGKPLVVAAVDAKVVIGHLAIAQNHRSCRVGWNNVTLSWCQPSRLVEIDRLQDILRDGVSVVPQFADAVDLNCQ